VLAIGLVLVGLTLATIGLYGLLRMREINHQLHAAGLVTTPAVLSVVLAALATRQAETITSALLVIVFVVVTAPLSSHAIARAARGRSSGDPQGEGEEAAG
jgi:multicomponent Na+:H+ antiporter subunit G